MRHPLLIPIALAAIPLAPAAHAQCVSTGPLEITCQPGNDPVGVDDTRDDLTVVVTPEGTVGTTGDGIVVGDGAVVTLQGSVSAGEDGVVGGQDLTLEVGPTGVIDAGDDAVVADDEPGLTVRNEGLIRAADKGITVDDGVGARLENSGVVEVGNEAFEAGDDAVVINEALALIVAGEDAVQVGRRAVIVNDGEIIGGPSEGDGIDVDSGDIQNGGVIRGEDAAGIDFDAEGPDDALVTQDSTILNLAGALIEGIDGILVDPDNVATQIVTNAGTIRGTGGTAIDLGRGEDLVELEPGSAIEGDVLLGAGDDALAYARDPLAAMLDDFGLFDGGEGTDRATLSGFAAADVTGRLGAGGVVDLALERDGARLTLRLANFEEVALDDAVLTPGQIAVIPLPAGLPLLAAGLGGLALLRRRPRA